MYYYVFTMKPHKFTMDFVVYFIEGEVKSMEINLNTGRPVKNKNILKNILTNLIPKDFIPVYTLLSIFAKNILLVGFIFDQSHQSPLMGEAFNAVFQLYRFRPVYYIAFSLASIWIIFLFKNRGRFLVSIILNFLVSFLLLVDLWYLRGFNTLPTLHMLKAGGNLGDSINSFFPLIHLIDLLFVLDIPVLAVIFLVKKNLYRNVSRNAVFSAFILFVSVLGVFYIAPGVNNQASKPLPITSIFNRFNPITTIRSLSPLGYNIYSSYNFFTEKSTINLSKTDKDRISAWYEQKNEKLFDNEFKGMFKGKNLLLIQVESLEAFVINQKVNGQEITPVLNKLLKNSLYFSGIHEQVGGGNSSDSDLMVNASVYPVQLGTTFINNAFTEYNSFPKLLKGIGYYTSTFHPVDGAFWNWKPALTSMGYDKCYDSTSYNITERINMGISDRLFLEQIEPMLIEQKQPFFSFVVTLSSHSPFELPEQYKGLKLEGELGRSRLGGYMQCINYTDRHIGLLLDRLDKDGILDDTLVAIIGDHEGVHKYFPDEIKSMKTREEWWLDNNKLLPLILYNSNINQKEIKTAGGQVDIMPTLAYLMGVDEESYINTAMGRNLLKTNKNYAVLRDGTMVGNPDDSDKKLAVQGLELSDIIIRGDYFKDR